ncbi:hypothetical protein RUM44_006137 [Polyplax serrata]|uniref:Uncharacterized protein n=1 Tax=Polyplax serrata TaxID=468196 RepID=A0ABR1AZ21_POLSC
MGPQAHDCMQRQWGRGTTKKRQMSWMCNPGGLPAGLGVGVQRWVEDWAVKRCSEKFLGRVNKRKVRAQKDVEQRGKDECKRGRWRRTEEAKNKYRRPDKWTMCNRYVPVRQRYANV